MALARSVAWNLARGVSPRTARQSHSAAAIASAVEKIHPRLVLENLDTAWDYSCRMRLPQKRCARPLLASAGDAVQPGLDSTKLSPHQMPVVPVKFEDPHVEGTFELPPKIYGQCFKRLSEVAPRKLWSANDGLEKEVCASALDVQEVLSLDTDTATADWDTEGVCAARERIALWIEQLYRNGVGKLVNVKPHKGSILDVVRSIFKSERGTAYGPSFTIKSVANPNNLAYNSQGLLGHTDQPYMEQPPAIQLFHCITQASEGGESRFLDGFALAHKVWEQDAEAFDVLSRHRVLFQDLTPEWHLEAYHPIFETAGVEGESIGRMPALKRVNFNEQCRDSWRQYDPEDPSQSADSLGRFYDALAMLESLVWEEKELAFRLQPGEVIVSDNWRTFHNRSGFVGERHFEGCYIDWDIAEAIWRRSSRARP